MENIQEVKETQSVSRNRTVRSLIQTWTIDPNGSAHTGQRCQKSDAKSGFGKMVDIYGNLLIGRFKQDCFMFGFVVNHLGHLYIVPFSPALVFQDVQENCGFFESYENCTKDLTVKENADEWYASCK